MVGQKRTPYTIPQQEAIDIIDQDVQIIACAGSGKTRVVSARVVNILKKKATSGIKPENIVAFTFTDKAAAELKDRITRIYFEEFGNVQGLAGLYVGTIHGFCLEILQQYLLQFLKYDVLDDVRQRLLIDRNSTKSGLHNLGMKRWVESALYQTVLSVVREAELDHAQLQFHPVRRSLEMYQDLLDAHRYLDFDEILLRAVVELQSNPDLQESLRSRVKYLTVDEYQDVSPIQEMLVRRLHGLGANLCVVGDDDQNIYQWRGSDVRHILEFARRYGNVVQKPLETNFRSTSAVVSVASQAVQVNPNRLQKQMDSGGSRQFERGDLLALRFANPRAEADWIADKIQRMIGTPYQEEVGWRGLSWSDFSVLLRSVKNCAPPVVDVFRAQGIPYVVAGMNGLFDAIEIQAAVGIFHFVIDAISEATLRQLWLGATLGLDVARINKGIALLKDRRTFDPGKRFSLYSLQRVFLDFLEALELREEQIPGGRGEVVYYNFGKFSQVITDYEEIHFKSKPEEKYKSFVQFLRFQAPGYYPEGGQDEAYAVPDAVRIMTVHQAKGMEFPVVFIPCLQKNRFPSKKQHNRVWQHIPRQAVLNADRYDTSDEDERRLLYVALTRSEKFLFCTWAPDAGNQLYRRPSPFWEELTRRQEFLTNEPATPPPAQLLPKPRRPLVNVELSFSELKYFFECPYQFKLRFLYGFNPPIHEALGYGRSLHNALAEIHRRALAGERISKDEIPNLVDKHLQVRYAYPDLEASLRESAQKALDLYLAEHGAHLDKLVHAEEMVELTLPDGIVVNGRIDLIKRTDTNETVVVDFKSVQRAQAEDVTRLQLHVYALGYEQRFGKKADLIEIHNLDHGGSVREVVDQKLTAVTTRTIREAGQMLRDNQLGRVGSWCDHCQSCDLVGICRNRPVED